jgi:arsenite-transporting ATPase
MLLALAQSKKVLFVGGKGGVGKTTVASSLAVKVAQRGRRVLLVSTDPAHNLGHIFSCKIGNKIVSLTPQLSVTELDPKQTTEKHLKSVAVVLRELMPERLWGEIDKHIALSKEAPGMHEAALLERIAEIVTQALNDYDLVIFDTAPSGHTARLMALPELMSAWTEGLMKRQQKSESYDKALNALGSGKSDETLSRDEKIRAILSKRQQLFSELRSVLKDKAVTAFIIVLAAERLPVLETIEFDEQLKRNGINVAAMVVNKRASLSEGELLAERSRQEEHYLELLRKKLPKIPYIEIPLQAGEVNGIEALEGFGVY